MNFISVFIPCEEKYFDDNTIALSFSDNDTTDHGVTESNSIHRQSNSGNAAVTTDVTISGVPGSTTEQDGSKIGSLDHKYDLKMLRLKRMVKMGFHIKVIADTLDMTEDDVQTAIKSSYSPSTASGQSKPVSSELPTTKSPDVDLSVNQVSSTGVPTIPDDESAVAEDVNLQFNRIRDILSRKAVKNTGKKPSEQIPNPKDDVKGLNENNGSNEKRTEMLKRFGFKNLPGDEGHRFTSVLDKIVVDHTKISSKNSNESPLVERNSGFGLKYDQAANPPPNHSPDLNNFVQNLIEHSKQIKLPYGTQSRDDLDASYRNKQCMRVFETSHTKSPNCNEPKFVKRQTSKLSITTLTKMKFDIEQLNHIMALSSITFETKNELRRIKQFISDYYIHIRGAYNAGIVNDQTVRLATYFYVLASFKCLG
jgi:hypothetical protein